MTSSWRLLGLGGLEHYRHSVSVLEPLEAVARIARSSLMQQWLASLSWLFVFCNLADVDRTVLLALLL